MFLLLRFYYVILSGLSFLTCIVIAIKGLEANDELVVKSTVSTDYHFIYFYNFNVITFLIEGLSIKQHYEITRIRKKLFFLSLLKSEEFNVPEAFVLFYVSRKLSTFSVSQKKGVLLKLALCFNFFIFYLFFTFQLQEFWEIPIVPSCMQSLFKLLSTGKTTIKPLVGK